MNHSEGGGGVIRHKKSPHKYAKNQTCDWYIYGRKYSHITLSFDMFYIEGQLESRYLLLLFTVVQKLVF